MSSERAILRPGDKHTLDGANLPGLGGRPRTRDRRREGDRIVPGFRAKMPELCSLTKSQLYLL